MPKIPSRTQYNFNPFYGQRIDNEDILQSVCSDANLYCNPFTEALSSWSNIIERLCSGQIGCIMRGRYEIGPRALGNRSIIALAEFKYNHFRINAIKRREQWRPLAPAVLEENFSKYFSGVRNPYMLMTNKVLNIDLLPAITHTDGSARVQCVLPIHNNFYSLLKTLATYRADIHPVIINTSLNGKNQPMLNDCYDLVKLVAQSQLDFAITDNYLIFKS